MTNTNYTFKNLNPDAERFGLSEDDYYQLCLQLLEVVFSYEGGRYRPRAMLEELKGAGFEDGEMAACHYCDLLMPDNVPVRDTLAMLREFLPDKADRRAVLTHMLTEDFFAPVDVEDEKYIGCWFNYNNCHYFEWSLTGTLFFEYAYDYEVIHGI